MLPKVRMKNEPLSKSTRSRFEKLFPVGPVSEMIHEFNPAAAHADACSKNASAENTVHPKAAPPTVASMSQPAIWFWKNFPSSTVSVRNPRSFSRRNSNA
jgi:hypothetical protein